MYLVAKTIYIVAHDEHNKDEFVVHRRLIGTYGSQETQRNYIINLSLAAIRKKMRDMQLMPIDRVMGEDPLIVEKWI